MRKPREKQKDKKHVSTLRSAARKAAQKRHAGKRTVQNKVIGVGKKKYAREAGLTDKQFRDFIYLVATSLNFQDADGLISKFYPGFKAKDKCELLFNNFNFRIAAGKNMDNNYEACYGFAIQFILGQSRAFGPEFIIK